MDQNKNLEKEFIISKLMEIQNTFNLTKADLCRILHVPYLTLERLMNKDHHNSLTIKQLKAILDFFQIKVEDFFSEKKIEELVTKDQILKIMLFRVN